MTPKQKNICCMLLILAVVLFYLLSGGTVGISLDFGEESLLISVSHCDWDIPYGQIHTLELIPLTDPGTLIDGAEKTILCYGTWENDLWGNYTLCVDPRVETCIVITLDDGAVYVLNYETDTSTQELYKMFTDLLQYNRN